ncbi:MAG TPA: sugar phosphate nucleotidyltransferase [Polyangia bacterium]|nr:sugar phosphate nucleotidyltransferase [Polyangia bacterium]
MNVMLLAAGRSTRLGALGLTLPKPLVPICGYPAIAFGLDACARAGLASAVVNVFHHGDRIQEALGDGRVFGVCLRYSVERDLLGTGGGIAKARPLFGPGPVLVMNAKVVADLDLPALFAAHDAGRGVATMLLRDDPDPRRWGAIAVDSTGRVVEILGSRSPIPPQGSVTARMFTGVHVVDPVLLDRLAPRPCDVIRDAYIPALEAGARIVAARLPGYFAEHSTPERYLAGNLALLEEPTLLRQPPGPLVGIDPGALVAEGAGVTAPVRIAAGAVVEAGAHVGPGVVVGSGAVVRAGVRLSRAVVWPNVVVTADASEAVLTPDGPVAIS